MHELHVAEALACSLFDDVDRVWAGDLKVEPIVGPGRRVIVTVTQLVVCPETSSAEQHELLAVEATDDAFVNDLPVLVAMDDMLRLADGEFSEDVDGKL